MFKTLKKITSALAATILIIQHCTFLVFGAGDFTISLLQIRGLAGSYAANPGTTFSIGAYTSNNLPEPIQSVFINVDFGNNAGFAYQGVDQRSRINNAIITNPIPSSTYSASTGLYAEITSAGTPQVGAGQSFDMTRSTPSDHAWFLINSDISTYANTMTIHYVAQKVSDSTTVTGDTKTETIYANVKPHITDSYFEKADGSTTTNQIQGDQAESISLVLKVKDYNGCANIDGGLVSADLSVIWLSSSENLSYVSCDVDGKTAIFKKSGISTLAGLGDKIFPYTAFYARDENSNVMDPNDGFTTFDDEDKKSDLVLTVIAAAAPNVSTLSVSDTVIGWPSKSSSTLSFSGSQGGEIKVAIGSNGSCVGGTTITDWTGSGSYTAHTATGVTILATSLAEGSNAVYLCVRNSGGNIWSTSVTLTKDSVAPAFVTIPGFTNANVTSNDPGFSIRCNESGIYQIEIGGNGTMGNGTFGNSGSIVANTTINPSISNSLLAFGANVIHIFCQDAATNTVAHSGSVNKIAPTPTMAGQTTAFIDSDTDNDGLDGRDMTLSWNNSNAVGFADFQSYRIYILPNSTAFNTGSQTHVKLLTDKNLSTWTGDASITKDSLGVDLVSGASYKACIAILGNSGQLGTEGCTASTVLTADTVSHPLVLSAKFTSDTNLEVTTNATLDSNLSSHSGALLSFVRGSTVTATAVASVSTNKINFTVPSLGSIAATGSTLLIATGSIRANGGGYNDYFSSGSLIITDGQNPTITSFTKNTSAPYGTFYTGSINFSYTFGENMLGGGNTRLELTRTSGASDGVTHTTNITAPSELASGNQSKTIDISTLSLVSGTTYRAQVIGKDLVGNSVNGAYITNITYDNVGPAAPTVVDAINFSTLTPLLSWTAPTDDAGNGSWVGSYTLLVYDGATCATGSLVQTYASILAPATSQTLTTLATNPGTYSWKITATDRMGNIGNPSTCDTFDVDTNLPTISGQTITDQTLSSSTYTKNGNTLAITANINNTNAAHIWLDASAVSGNSFYNDVLCSAPPTGITCNYNAGTVTFGFNTSFSGTVASGVRQVQFRAQNTSGLNEQTALASITVDNNAPSVSASTITSPNGGEIWGGTGRTITWNAGSVTDSIGLTSIRLEYSTGANVWNLIANTTNAGNYVWDITSIESRGDYTIKITAFDHVGNTASDTSNSTFTIDRTAPTVPSDTLITPNGGIYRWGLLLPLLWNNASIMDGGWLLGNPITLEYSTNNGTNWSSIATSLANTGSYNWTIPSINTATALVRITATDTANNSSYDQSDSNFIIDSAVPVQNISYAGGGGNTPQSGRKINNTGLDLTLSATDAYLDQVYYQFANTSDGLYWNNSTSGWLGITTWNTLCTDGTSLGTNLACSNISSSISPTILDGKAYSLILRSIDEAGNTTTSITHTYTGDIQVPSLTISNSSGSFLSNSFTFSGTSSDTDGSISSVKIEITKGAQYWDGSAWVGSITSLLTQTSNGYANWNYVFSPPLSDTDGQNYMVTVTAYDNAYKVNNSTSSSITVIKDDSGPSIASDVFTFDTAPMYQGNTPFTITWNPAKITASGANLATNPITLSYNFTGTVVTIAENIANSGSYVMQLPLIDTSTAKIIISAVDTIGNDSNAVASAEFNIDSLPPTISTITTMDMDVDGQIDAIQVTMNESIKDSSITLANFSLSLGIGTPTGWVTGMSSNDETFILNFTNTGTTASTPTLSYIAGSLVDRADNHLANVTNRASIDGVVPRVQQVRMYDENANGKMDLIQVQFGENMQTSTAAAFLINNTLAGMTIASVSRDGASLDTFNLVLNESTVADTSVGSMTLDFTNNGTFRDTAGNSAVNFSNQAIADLAKPILLTVRTVDSSSNAKVDRIDVQFSENISGNIDGEWSMSGLATWSTKGTTSITTDTLKISINETSDDNDTAITPSLSYSGTSLIDSTGNSVNSFSNQTVTDGVSPKLLTRTTKDFDGNGKIDAIMFTFSENLGANFTAFNTDVAGYTVSGYDSLCSGSTSGDAIICISLTEKTTTDTDAVPNTQILSNTTLADTASNLIVPEITPTGASDSAGPIIIGAQYDSGGAAITDDTILLTFSEILDPASVSGISSDDFIVSAGGAFGSNSTTAYTNGNTATITLGADATALTPGVSKISIITGAISDTLTNVSPTEWVNNRVTVSSSVIINEVMWSNTGSSVHQYIELKNTGGSSVNINGWTIANAWGNGVDLTLPNATIAGGGIYLIAKTSESSSLLNVTPDLISNTLDLSVSQNNLIFKSGAVIYDTVKANPWPSGNNETPSSMERKNPAGDGTVANSWYTAQSSVGFDTGNTLVRGTPGTANIFDAASPVMSSYSPQNNALVSVSPKQITFTYSDSGGSLINTTSDTLSLQKWNGSSFDDVTGTYINLGGKTITQTGALYPVTNAPFGKYRATFSIADSAGNTTQQIIDFTIDQISFTISGNTLDMGRLTAGNLDLGTDELVITVTTVGAGFTLSQSKVSQMSATGGIQQIQDFDGSNGYGFDYAESGSGNTTSYSGAIQSVNNLNIATYPVAIDPNGNRKTYIYRVKYGAKITAVQAAGNYSGMNDFDINWNY